MKKALTFRLMLAGLAGLFAVNPVAGQATRSGLWAEAGAGSGGLFFNCSACESPIRSFGESFHIRAGFQLSDRVFLGLEVHSLFSETFQPTGGNRVSEVEVVSVSPVVVWYPWRYGLFVKGGFGVSKGEFQTAGTEDNPHIQASGTGSGMSAGAGIDIPIIRWVAITAGVAAYVGALGDVDVDGVLIDDVISTSYDFTLGVVIR